MKFENPYLPDSVKEPVIKCTLLIPNSRVNKFRSIRPRNGTLSTVANILIEKLYDTCNKRGWTLITTSEFERFVSQCELINPGEFVGPEAHRPVGEANHPDDKGGTVDVPVRSAPERPVEPVTTSVPSPGSGKARPGKRRVPAKKDPLDETLD